MIGQHYLSYDTGYHGIATWARVYDFYDGRIYFDVLQGEDEGRSMSLPTQQFTREFYRDPALTDPPNYKQVFGR